MDEVTYEGRFVWDRQKARDNIIKHGIRFEDAVRVFKSLFYALEYDEKNSIAEDRYKIIGTTNGMNCVTVSFTERGDMTRIFSARDADNFEEEAYEDSMRNYFGSR